MWGFKASHDRDARLFADILNFSSVDSPVLQHFTNAAHQVHSTSLLKESKPETEVPKNISNTLVSGSQNDAQSFSPQPSTSNLIDLHSDI